MDLEELYKVAPWPMRPDDPRAQDRFAKILELFTFLLGDHPFFKPLVSKRLVKVLDVMAGSGIAGAAFAKALTEKGLKVDLTVSDIRSSDLQLVHVWLRGVKRVKIRTVVAEVARLHEVMHKRAKYYDAVLLWGLSTPHLDPWEMVRAYSSICYLLNDSGIMAMDEVDRIFGIFYRIGYKDFLVEGESKGATVASIHVGYDEKRGVFKRATYKLPGFEKVATLDYRFWDLAGIAAIGWLFFKDVDLVSPNKHKVQGIPHIILLNKPRRKIQPEDLKMKPSFVAGLDKS